MDTNISKDFTCNHSDIDFKESFGFHLQREVIEVILFWNITSITSPNSMAKLARKMAKLAPKMAKLVPKATNLAPKMFNLAPKTANLAPEIARSALLSRS